MPGMSNSMSRSVAGKAARRYSPGWIRLKTRVSRLFHFCMPDKYQSSAEHASIVICKLVASRSNHASIYVLNQPAGVADCLSWII